MLKSQARRELVDFVKADFTSNAEPNGKNRGPIPDDINAYFGIDMGNPYCIGGLCKRSVVAFCKAHGLIVPRSRLSPGTQDFWQANHAKYGKLKGEVGDAGMMQDKANHGLGHAWMVWVPLGGKLYKSAEYNTNSEGARDGHSITSHVRSTDGDDDKTFLGFIDLVAMIADVNPGVFKDDPAPSDKPLPPVVPTTLPQLAWSKVHTSLDWTADLISVLAVSTLPDLAPNGIEKFWPGYVAADRERRLVFWAQLISAICRPESDFDPHAIAKGDVEGTDSIGLLQLSYEDVESYRLPAKLDRSKKELEDPLMNLYIGILIMEAILKPGVQFAGKGDNGKWQGLSTYWSTMREGRDSYIEIVDYLQKVLN